MLRTRPARSSHPSDERSGRGLSGRRAGYRSARRFRSGGPPAGLGLVSANGSSRCGTSTDHPMSSHSCCAGRRRSNRALFSPRGDWLAVPGHESFAFWPRRGRGRNPPPVTPSGVSHLLHAGLVGARVVRGGRARRLADGGAAGSGRSDPAGDGLLRRVSHLGGRPSGGLGSPGGRSARHRRRAGAALPLHVSASPLRRAPWGAAFDATGQKLAMGATYARRARICVLRVFDLATGTARAIPLVPPGEAFKGYEWNTVRLAFAPEGKLLVGGDGRDPALRPRDGRVEVAPEADAGRRSPSGSPRTDARRDGPRPWDTAGAGLAAYLSISHHGGARGSVARPGLTCVAISAVRPRDRDRRPAGHRAVGPIEGGEPHLLLGHAGAS